MSSTLLGLVCGIVIAAVVTTQYGDHWAFEVRSWLPEEIPTVAPDEDAQSQAPSSNAEQLVPVSVEMPALIEAPQVNAAPNPQAAPVAAAPQAVAVSAQAEPEPIAQVTAAPEPEPDTLEELWQAFAAEAAQLEPGRSYPWQQCFTRASAAYDVSEVLLLAIASGESGFDPAARSDKDAIGLMQIRWPTTSHHLGVRREADLYDPCTNVAAGARYVAELSERFDHDLHLAVAAYNYGPSAIEPGAVPEGARWYSQYIYQHLQQVLGRPHAPTSELIRPASSAGFEVLYRFNQPYRAREIIAFLETQVPGLELAQRSETLGQHEVVLLYQDESERLAALDSLRQAGLALPGRYTGIPSTF